MGDVGPVAPAAKLVGVGADHCDDRCLCSLSCSFVQSSEEATAERNRQIRRLERSWRERIGTSEAVASGLRASPAEPSVHLGRDAKLHSTGLAVTITVAHVASMITTDLPTERDQDRRRQPSAAEDR